MVALLASTSGSLAENNVSQVFDSGVTDWNSEELIVGETGDNNSLLVTNGAQLVNVDEIRVGDSIGANNNSVTITGTNSLLEADSFYLGYFGADSRLTIANGGVLSTFYSDVGYWEEGTRSRVLVTDPGSLWFTDGNMNFGDWSAANIMVISNEGAVVTLGDTYIGGWIAGGGGGSSGGNQVTVTGTNSYWGTDGEFILGYYILGNTVRVTDGALMETFTATVGYQTNSYQNKVVISGGGAWYNYSDLTLGLEGRANSLIITNLGELVNYGDAYIGRQSSSVDNSVLVDNAYWFNDGTLYLGHGSAGNSLVISNGEVYSASGSVGTETGANNNSVSIGGLGGLWDVTGALVVGDGGRGNQLTVHSGATLFSASGVIGNTGGSNTVTVTGIDSWWDTGTLTVGANGAGNTLLVQNGAFLWTGLAVIGANSSNNLVNVQDATWLSTDGIIVGSQGVNNRLQIGQGSYVESAYAIIGDLAGANLNQALLTGADTYWYNEFEVIVGWEASQNELRVESGATLDTASGYIGVLEGANNNNVIVNGGDWFVDGDLFVGEAGSGNQLSVANGNVEVNGSLVVGEVSAANRLTINGGGNVYALNLYIGADAGGSTNVVSLNGNADLFVDDTLYVGFDGSRNRLEINSGANVDSLYGVIGTTALSANNAVSLNGVTSRWFVEQDLFVGFESMGNSLSISGGALVDNVEGYVGFLGSGNSATIAGSGSVWSNYGALVVGYGGNDNQVAVQSGGAVYNDFGYIGMLGDSNRVSVTGSGSRWHSASGLILGDEGAHNSLLVSNGGVVLTPSLLIGTVSGYAGNQANIMGGGSLVVTNGGTGELLVGYGTLNLLGGTVVADQLLVTNVNSLLNFNSGTITAGVVLAQNGLPFTVGTGIASSSLVLGDGPSLFVDGLVVPNLGQLSGSGVGLNITGNYQQQAGGALRLGVVDTAEYQQLAIDGTAELDGILRVVQSGDWIPGEGDSIVVLNATGGRTNEFASFQNNTALWANLIYGPDTVTLEWTNIVLTGFATTPNQTAVAQAIDDALPDPRLASLVALLNDSLNTNQMPQLLDAIAPEELGALFLVPVASMDAFGNQFRSRVSSLRSGLRGFDATRMRLIDWEEGGTILQPPSAPVNEPVLYSWGPELDPLSPAPSNPWGFYIDGAGAFLQVNDTPNAKGYDSTASGMTLGADRWMTPNLVLGATLGYAGDSSDLVDGGELEADGARGSIYAAYLSRGWHLEGMLAGSWHSMETRRNVGGEFAEGETEATSFSVLFSGGYDWTFDRLTVGPEAVVQFTSVQVEGYTEKNSAAPLSISDDSIDAFRTQLGLRAGYRMVWGDTAVVLPYASAGWRHDFMDETVPITARFASGAGDQFTVHSAELGSDSIALALGVSVQWNLQFNTYLGYSTEIGRQGYQLHNINGGFRFNF